MRVRSQYFAHFTLFILILTITGTEVCFARNIHLENVSNSSQIHPRPESILVNEHGESLELESLERRIRESSSLGLFDKLSIKSEVDELIHAISNYHQGKRDVTLNALRVRFEELLSRVTKLLKNDVALRRDLASSREALWKMLLDPVRFANR